MKPLHGPVLIPRLTTVHIAVVGPTHPFKGGISQHTTVLARELESAGHDVELVSWLRQYPRRLYPGSQEVERREFPPFPRVRRTLSWNRPDSWLHEAFRLREFDLVVLAHVTPVQVLPYRSMLAVLRRFGTRTVVICHNVLPHERSRGDRLLVRSLLNATDVVLTHSVAEETVAKALTTSPVRCATLAPFLPPDFRQGAPTPGVHNRLLFFGLIRPYKGLDVLLRALARGPSSVCLRVVGEFWGGTEATVMLCRELGIQHRVELVPGYAPADRVPDHFRDVDALVLPYRTATGSQGVWTGFEFGVPVIATSAGHLADDITAGVDGLVAAPDDVEGLARALDDFYAPGVPERLRAAVRPVDPRPYWDRYMHELLRPTTPGPA